MSRRRQRHRHFAGGGLYTDATGRFRLHTEGWPACAPERRDAALWEVTMNPDRTTCATCRGWLKRWRPLADAERAIRFERALEDRATDDIERATTWRHE